jgi:TRAP-type C4-dicarboxylate transport system substrate-binding protein
MRSLATMALSSVVAFFGISGSVLGQSTETMKFGVAAPANGILATITRDFADALKRDSSGRVLVDVIPDGQLGNEPRLLQQLRADTLDLAFISSLTLALPKPGFEIDLIPFIATDYYDADLLDTLSKEVLEKQAQQLNLTLLFPVRLPPVGLLRLGSPTVLASFANIKGERISISGPFGEDLAKRLDVQLTQTAIPQLSTAFQSVAISGAFLPLTTVATLPKGNASTFEDLRMLYPKYFVVMSRQRLLRLSANDQNALRKSVAGAERPAREKVLELDATTRKRLAEAGVAIRLPPVTVVQASLAIGRSMANGWGGTVRGGDMRGVLATYNSANRCDGADQCGRTDCRYHHHCQPR